MRKVDDGVELGGKINSLRGMLLERLCSEGLKVKDLAKQTREALEVLRSAEFTSGI